VFSEYLYSGFFGRIAEILLFTLAYAIPFFLCTAVLLIFNQKIISAKIILAFITLILGCLPVIALTTLIDEPISRGYILGTLVYILLNCVCLFFYKLKPLSSGSKIKGSKFPGVKNKIEGVISPSPIYS
ncbi:MAG TPA: hypothetical protein VGM63_00300, partial [Mucilaginibacter sp.]